MSYKPDNLNTTAVPNAHVEGLTTTAQVAGAHAEGDTAAAYGDGAHAEGLNTVAIGDQSHAEGNATISSEHVGHAEGEQSLAGNAWRPFTVSGTTVTIQGAVDDEFSNSNTVRFSQLTGGTSNTLATADRTIAGVTLNSTGSHVAYVAQGGDGSGPGPFNLYTINKSTGAVTLVGPLKLGSNNVSITGLAMDPTTGIMYAVSGFFSVNNPLTLFTVNLSTAALTLIAPIAEVGNFHPLTLNTSEGPRPDIAFDRHGNLWASCFNTGDLQVAVCTLNKTNGQSDVYKISQPIPNIVGLAFAFMNVLPGGNDLNRMFIAPQGTLMEINPVTMQVQNQLTITGPAAGITLGAMKFDENNVLYAVSNQTGVFALYTIDIVTGASTSVALTQTYDAIAIAITVNTTFTISSGLSDRTAGMAVNPDAGRDDHAEGVGCHAVTGVAHAEGYRTTAVFNTDHAEGWLCIAAAGPTHAEGLNCSTPGFCGHSEGAGCFALWSQSHAEGFNTASRAQAAHSEGNQTIAAGNWSHAEGGTGQAYGDSSHAEGGSTIVNSEGGHVEGENNRVGNLKRAFTISGTTVTIAGGNFTSEFANGNTIRFADLFGGTNQTFDYLDRTISGVAFNSGPNTTTFTVSSALDDRTNGFCFNQFTGQDAHAEGSTNTATGFAAHVEGEQNTAFAESCHCEGNQNAIPSTGFAAHCEGTGNTSSGNASHCEGDSCTSTNFASHAEGNSTNATANGAHSEGAGTNASGAQAHAEGSSTTASGAQSHSEGNGSLASGIYAHAEGFQCQATMQATHAEGYQCHATNVEAHAEGALTTASGQSSHSEGNGSVASGDFSHAEGQSTTASGEWSHTEGSNTQATAPGAHAQGIAAVARFYGQDALAGANISTPGDAQATKCTMYTQTTSATSQDLFVGGVQRLTIAADTTYGFRVDVVARQTGGTDTCAFFSQMGFLTRQTTLASTRLNLGTQTIITDAGSATWTVAITADTTNGALKITVTGQASKNINWVATVWLTETIG